jgi:hypothetical protein
MGRRAWYAADDTATTMASVGVTKVFESTPSTAWAIPAANTITSTVSGARRRHASVSPITSPVIATTGRGPPTTTPDHTSAWARPATPSAKTKSRRPGEPKSRAMGGS